MDTTNLPPTRKGRTYELHALGLREFAGLRRPTDRLNPFDLARFAKLLVVSFDKVESLLTEETKKRLLGEGKDDWSGGASSQTLPNGQKLIILNPTHGKNRQNATLMEEISHVFLGHKPSRLAIEMRDESGNVRARDYNAEIEEQAYSVGAAALVPYAGLHFYIVQGKTSRDIARHYDVSYQLIEYRIKVSRLWKEYLEIQASKKGLG